jgi:hypothetical protein
MQDDLIRQTARLMCEQAAAYRQLESVCHQLAAKLVGGDAASIEALAKTGESELLRMRARLLQIISKLAQFSDARKQNETLPPLTSETREAFEAASNALFDAARAFQTAQRRASALTMSGASFMNACIEMCGVAPMTYSAFVSRRAMEAAR